MMETANGEPVNIGPCQREAAVCVGQSCEHPFRWEHDGFTTFLAGAPAADVRDMTAMNDQAAHAPAALVDSDPRDCLYNTASDAVFCWVPGPEAHSLAGQGNDARAALIALVSGQSAAPPKSGRKTAASAGPDPDTLALLERMQGVYRVLPSWNCRDIGMDGGAVAVLDAQMIGVETTCDLTDGMAVGSHGTALFKARCTGEGETWEEEIILQRDMFGRLAVLHGDGVAIWETCD